MFLLLLLLLLLLVMLLQHVQNTGLGARGSLCCMLHFNRGKVGG